MRIPRHALAALLAVCVTTPAAVLAQTPTLGELARKEQERRRALKAPGRVITEQDLLSFATPQVAAPPATADAPTSAREHTAAHEANGKDEAWWRKTMAETRADVRRAELIGAALQSRISALANDVAGRDDPHQRAALTDERQRAIVELERLASERDRLKKKLADLEEEARRSGVPPGWLR